MNPDARHDAPVWQAVSHEVAAALSHVDPGAFERFRAALSDTGRRWFFSGQGRSGLVAQMSAMRFMHAGFACHFVGEVTAPSIRRGDGLLIVSGSGETPVSLSWAGIARAEGAMVVAVTRDPGSTLARLADVVMPVPRLDSRQFGGSLFEQTSLLMLDAVMLSMTAAAPGLLAEMAFRHTNLQ